MASDRMMQAIGRIEKAVGRIEAAAEQRMLDSDKAGLARPQAAEALKSLDVLIAELKGIEREVNGRG